jgi:hypothetical protein
MLSHSFGLAPHVTPAKKANSEAAPRRSFSSAEDRILFTLVTQLGRCQWADVATALPGRSARQCRERWRTVLSPGLVNGPWSRAEDDLLLKLYNEHGPKWSFIAKHFQGRSDCNVKNRWARHLFAMTPKLEVPELPMVTFEDTLEWGLGGQVDNCFIADPFINW